MEVAQEENVRLFVGGLPDGCTEGDLMDLFKDCEPVEAFMCGSKHPPCGFVTIKRSDANLEKAQSFDGTSPPSLPPSLPPPILHCVHERASQYSPSLPPCLPPSLPPSLPP